MKIDPYNHKERYLSWKEKTVVDIPKVSKANSILIKQYLSDMERGINVATGSVKGARSYTRLNSLRDKMVYFSKKFEEHFKINKVTEIDEEKLVGFISDMKNGTIKKEDGKTFQSVDIAFSDN